MRTILDTVTERTAKAKKVFGVDISDAKMTIMYWLFSVEKVNIIKCFTIC